MSGTHLLCREIEDEDLPAVIDLLTVGFARQRDRGFWRRAIANLAEHEPPPGYPKYGYLLANAGAVVGVILQIFSQPESGAGVRCNMSSWWVMPEFRLFGSLLISRALRHDATYTNITPAPQTLPLLEAQGYRTYCAGRMVALPWLAIRSERARVSVFSCATRPGAALTECDLRILRDHAAYGCISLVCEADGRRYPFVFAPRRRLGVVRLAVLTYCRADADFLRFAGPLGRALLRLGFPLAVLDADGRIPGMPGLYSGRKPKHYRGKDRPRIRDHAYSERALFGS